MKLLLDTNVFVTDYKLSGSNFRLLEDAISRLGVQLLIPELIVEEVIGTFDSRLDDFHGKLLAQIDKFKRFSTSTLECPINIEREKELFRQRFLSCRKSWSARSLAYPDVPHEELVRRAISRKKPFDNRGSGYRDALIWETLLETLRREETPVIFITKNTRDFCTAESLHSDLLADLDRLDIPRDRLTVFTSLDDFNAKITVPGLHSLDELFAAFAQDQAHGFSLREWAECNLIDLLNKDAWGAVMAQLQDTNADVYADELLEILGLEIDDVRQLSNGSILLSATLSVEVELLVDASTDEIRSCTELKEIFEDEDLSSTFASTWTVVEECVEVRLILEPQTLRVASAEIDGASGGPRSIRSQHHYVNPPQL